MNIVIDPDVPGDELRQQLYAGNLVILTRLQALADFVDYTREELTELFKPHDPEHRARAHRAGRDGEDPGVPGSPASSTRSGPRSSSGRSSRKRVPARADPLRPAQAADLVPGRAPDTRASPSPSPGTATSGTAPRPSRSTGGFPIFPVREDNAMSFDLASFAQAVPNSSDAFDYYQNNASRLTTASQVTQERQARPGAIDHHPEPGTGRPAGARRGPAVLRRPAAHLHSQHLRPGPVQRRLPHGRRPRPDGRPRRPAGGRALHRHRDHGTSSTSADESSFDEQFVVELFGAPPADAMLVFGSPEPEVAAELRAVGPGQPRWPGPIGQFTWPGRAGRPWPRTGWPAGRPCPRCARRASSAPGPRCSPAS